jgi:hypothetical protein
MRAPQPRTFGRLKLISAWANDHVRWWLVGVTIPRHDAAPAVPSGNCFWTDGPASCAIVPGTNFARCRCWYRPRRGDRGALLGKAEP